MHKKVVILFSLLFVFSLFSILSCVKCGPFPDKYKVIDVKIEPVSVDYDTAGLTLPVLTELDTNPVHYTQFGLLLNPITQTYFSSNFYPNSFGIINSAYACSPVKPYTDDYITNIEIYTDKDFDAKHSKDDNLAEYFDVFVADNQTNTVLKKDLISYLKSKPTVPHQIVLQLNTPPVKDTSFVFTVIYTQKGVALGSVNLETEVVRLIR